MKNYTKLKTLFKRLSHLQYVQRILMWDEAVMMPEGAGESRAAAIATLSRTIQKMLINNKTKNLIEIAKHEDNLSPWDIANIRLMDKKYHSASCISLKLNEEATKASMICEQAWRKFRPNNNWKDFLPYLEKSFHLTMEIAKERAEALSLNPYDACIDQYAPGFNQNKIDSIFSTLKRELPPLMHQIMVRSEKNNIKNPKGPFPVEKQKGLGLVVMKALGFDFQYGRLDESHHPFCSGGPTDVRITTRYSDNEFLESLTSICHETGHALYEQGLPREWIDQPVGMVESMAMHESQSLLIEMEICRSIDFFEYLTPLVKNQFGEQEAFSSHNLYELNTQVKPGLIRVQADEITYPLHIILRYEIEKGLFNGEIKIKDLPLVWNDLMVNYLGLSTLENNQNGVMQDVHWPAGLFGYFPAYTLGRLIASQLFATYKNLFPQYKANIKMGNFAPLKSWLKQNIYSYGSSLSTDDLLLKVTGKKLDTVFFIEHAKQRYLSDE